MPQNADNMSQGSKEPLPSTNTFAKPASPSTTTSPSDASLHSSIPPTSTDAHSIQDRRATRPQESSFFTIPAPLRRLFDRFPLVTYPENELPSRSPRAVLRSRIKNGIKGERDTFAADGKQNVLYVFTTEEEARLRKASFNPGCLKWQAYLKFCNVSFATLPSSNHASPTGVLPFLLPSLPAAATERESASLSSTYTVLNEHLPIPTSKLQDWASSQPGASIPEESNNIRYDAYMSLLDFRIRHAWLYNLYLEPLNFSTVAYPLYISPVSSNPAVRATVASQLTRAAAHELLTHQASSGSSGCVADLNSSSWSILGNNSALAASYVDVDDLYSEAENAFDALEKLLGDEDEWFFGQAQPGMFDASVFAYTALLLRFDDDVGVSDAVEHEQGSDKVVWQEKRLVKALKRRRNLVRHCRRIEELYF
ncbi:hypothetical protein L228DRAFT_246412 [Xylona heveae TC161]|uniref:Mitochondrial outer membrane protein n=1 Tax=Xylona heveae (strain CBS 132557 / TC161) TaxID=1328760 RepID=A0A165HJG9_XYLHT|nr:hypothetical protein L228DRAFT_246412 [Xylona heveae TC161]KZF23605.1 hypothetical protein L228DRAFT_246412 [Xylona heveae TC161]